MLADQGLRPAIIAKIERAEVVADTELLNSIIDAADGVMVARGDLGVEVGDAQLIGIQKNLISTTRKRDRMVITATQMMESMISNSMPTRAEVFDVANAVLDGTDAVMLSAETAVGDFPVEVVTAIKIIRSKKIKSYLIQGPSSKKTRAFFLNIFLSSILRFPSFFSTFFSS